MSTLFELSAADLYSLLQKIKPNSAIDKDDTQSMQSKVTEWLLMNNFSTLHKFAKTGESWDVPEPNEDCQSCKNFKIQHKFVPQVVVSQPTPLGELVTFDVKAGQPFPASPRPLESSRSSKKSTKDYYSSAGECVTSCGNCCKRMCCFRWGELFGACFSRRKI